MELTEQEFTHAVAEINALVREGYRCHHGDYPWLNEANFDSWIQALEQDGCIEIPSFYALSGRPERVRRAGGAA